MARRKKTNFLEDLFNMAAALPWWVGVTLAVIVFWYLDSLAAQTVDLGGAYRITRNLDVTAGVRLSQERDRLSPITDSVQDSQAVYVGTQFRF